MSERVVVHQALKQLIVGCNALIYRGKDGLKHYPINRFVVSRDGNGKVCEIVTKERVNKKMVDFDLPNIPSDYSGDDMQTDDVEVYTYVKCDAKSGRWTWHQEVEDMIIPGRRSSAPKNASPRMQLRFKVVDGEHDGRTQGEECYGERRAHDER